MNNDTLAPFLTFQFFATALCIMAIVTAAKSMSAAHPPIQKVFKKSWFQAFILTPANLVLGFLFALPSGWLEAPNWTGRIVLGVCAGFLSNFMYSVFKKRVESVVGVVLPGSDNTVIVVDEPMKTTPEGKPESTEVLVNITEKEDK